MKVNFNDMVKVKLTDAGIEHLTNRHLELNTHIKSIGGVGIGPFTLTLDDEGYYTEQLWCLIEQFAPYIDIAQKTVFVDNTIVIADKKEK